MSTGQDPRSPPADTGATCPPEQAFKYMPSPGKATRFVDLPCGTCGAPGRHFDAAAMGPGIARSGLCVACLRARRGPARDVYRARARLKDALESAHPDWARAKVERIADSSTDELVRTPPLQGFDAGAWPICCADFSRALGEWSREAWSRLTKDGDGQAVLARVLGDAFAARSAWKDLPEAPGAAGTQATHVFRCGTCNKLAVVVTKK